MVSYILKKWHIRFLIFSPKYYTALNIYAETLYCTLLFMSRSG